MSKESNARDQEIFGIPLLLEGEDASAFDELCGRLYAAVKPADVIDEIYLDDVAAQEWEIFRWRRIKRSALRHLRFKALKNFLAKRIPYSAYRQKFEEDLEEVLRTNLEEGQTIKDAQILARDCAKDSPEAVDAVNEILARLGANNHLDHFLNKAQAEKAEELARDFQRRESNVVDEVDGLLAEASLQIDDLVVGHLSNQLELLERIDRLITIAESRRNATLREIDRRRAVLGQAVRRSVQHIEQDAQKLIDNPPPKVKGAA